MGASSRQVGLRLDFRDFESASITQLFLELTLPNLVKVTQLIMLPVTTVSDEGVFAALFLYRSIVWMPYIAEQNKMITEKRWRRSNLARFLDAVLYQVVRIEVHFWISYACTKTQLNISLPIA